MTDVRTDQELILTEDDYCPIITDDIDIEPEQIIYRKIIVNTANPDDSEYENIFVPRFLPPGTFSAMIREIALHGYSSLRYDPKEDHKLDIPVARDSIIIVQLPPLGGHKFIAPGIRLRKQSGQCRTDLYGGLRYVDDQGNSTVTPPNNCKLIYFFAKFQPGTVANPYIQPFLYDVYPTPIRLTVIDPDIRYPGNGGSTAEA